MTVPLFTQVGLNSLVTPSLFGYVKRKILENSVDVCGVLSVRLWIFGLDKAATLGHVDTQTVYCCRLSASFPVMNTHLVVLLNSWFI